MPKPRGVSPDAPARQKCLRNEGLSASWRTGSEIRPGAGADHGSAIATDLGSTNGTVLALPGLDAEELKPGIAVSLVPGAVLDLGDGVTIQVTNP